MAASSSPSDLPGLDMARHGLMLVSTSGAEMVRVEAVKSCLILATVLARLRDIENIPNGKLTLSWGMDSGAVKWSLESHGKEGTS